MSENKEYITQNEEMGTIHIAEDVLATIAATAVNEVEGVGGLSANIGSDIAELLGRKNLSKGVKIYISEDQIRVDCFIMIEYGYTIPEVAKSVQDSVSGAIESMTGLTVSAVNVSVGGISFEKETKKD